MEEENKNIILQGMLLCLRGIEMIVAEKLSGGFYQHHWHKWLDDLENFERLLEKM